MKKYFNWRMLWFIYLLTIIGIYTYMSWFSPNSHRNIPDKNSVVSIPKEGINENKSTSNALKDDWLLELKLEYKDKETIIATSTLTNQAKETRDAGNGKENKCSLGPDIMTDFEKSETDKVCTMHIEPILVEAGKSITKQETIKIPADFDNKKKYHVITKVSLPLEVSVPIMR